MRTRDEISEAHDRLVGILTGEAPNPFGPEGLSFLHLSADVLCWILEHDHNQTFAEKLQKLKQSQEDAGFYLVRNVN